MPNLNCVVQDLLLEVVDLKQEVSDLRSGGIPPPNLTPDQATIYIVASCVETGALSVCSALFVFEVEGIPCSSI